MYRPVLCAVLYRRCTSLPCELRPKGPRMREQAIIIYLATESCNSECSHFTTGLPNLATSLSLSRRRIKKEGERGKGELIDAWAERRRRGPIRARPIEKEGDRNCDLHNFWPELRVRPRDLVFRDPGSLQRTSFSNVICWRYPIIVSKRCGSDLKYRQLTDLALRESAHLYPPH